jgi:hypothetical protein
LVIPAVLDTPPAGPPFWHIIPDDMSIPFVASWPYRGAAADLDINPVTPECREAGRKLESTVVGSCHERRGE